MFLFDEQKQALSAPESWTGTDDITGKDNIWYPLTNDKSEKENNRIKKLIKQATEPDTHSGTWKRYTGTIMENSGHPLEESEVFLERYLHLLDTTIEASGDDIEDLSNLKIKKSQNIRQIVNKRMLIIEKEKNKDKTFMTSRDHENMLFCRSLEPQYHKSNKTRNDDQTLGEKRLSQQTMIFLPDESTLGKYTESTTDNNKSAKIKANSNMGVPLVSPPMSHPESVWQKPSVSLSNTPHRLHLSNMPRGSKWVYDKGNLYQQKFLLFKI